MINKEFIDQLDENGKYLGIVDKDKAHEKGLWHKAVHVWIVNDDKIILQYRCSQKKFYPNVWDTSFAGHVDSGESSIDAVIREGKEELGIDVDINKLSFLFTIKEQLTYNDIISNEFVDVFLLCDNVELGNLVLQDNEVGAIKYMDIDRFFDVLEEPEEKIMNHSKIYKQLKKVLRP